MYNIVSQDIDDLIKNLKKLQESLDHHIEHLEYCKKHSILPLDNSFALYLSNVGREYAEVHTTAYGIKKAQRYIERHKQ